MIDTCVLVFFNHPTLLSSVVINNWDENVYRFAVRGTLVERERESGVI